MSFLNLPAQEYLTPSVSTRTHVDELLRVMRQDLTPGMLARAMIMGSNGMPNTTLLPGLGLLASNGEIISDIYFLEIAVTNGLQSIMAKAMEQPDLRSELVDAAQHYEKYLSGVFSSYSQSNLCRDDKDTLFTKTALTHFLKDKLNCEQLLASALIHGDTQAFNLLRTHKYLKRYISNSELISFCDEWKFTPHPAFDLLGERVSDSIYLRKLLALDGDELIDLLKNDPRPALAHEQGSLLFETLFRTGSCVKDPTAVRLLVKWVEDGVDWYEGFSNAFGSPLDRVDVAKREKQPLREIGELLDKKQDNLRLVTLILKALPVELKVAFCSAPAEANKLYKVTREEFLRPHVSKSMLKGELSGGLGL